MRVVFMHRANLIIEFKNGFSGEAFSTICNKFEKEWHQKSNCWAKTLQKVLNKSISRMVPKTLPVEQKVWAKKGIGDLEIFVVVISGTFLIRAVL